MSGRAGLSEVPILETERTWMRGHQLDDFQELAQMWADERVYRHITGRPSTQSESWSRLLRYLGHWQALGFGYWVVEDKAGGTFLGEVGLADYRRDIVPSNDDIPEIGWVLATHAHGRGLATETARAALVWADQHLPSARTVCIVAPEHERSIHVARKIGYHDKHQADLGGLPTLVMERIRSGSDAGR